MLQLVQSSAARRAGGIFCRVSSGIEAARIEKFIAYREGGLKGRLFGFGLSWGGLSGCSRLFAGFLEILTNFSGLAAQHLRDTKAEKFVAYQEGGLKPAAG